MNRASFNIIIETEKVGGKTIFIASSPDINVFAEAESIEDVKTRFIEGVRNHLRCFPEEKSLLIKNQEPNELPMLTKVFI